jgi:FAD:protein FMN transferase
MASPRRDSAITAAVISPKVLLSALLLLSTSTYADVSERVQILMGTTARVKVWAADSSTCRQAIHSAYQALHRVDRKMSTYKVDSDLSRLNRDGSQGWVSVDGELVEVLVATRTLFQLSDGAFDPTVLPLMRLWGFRGGEPRRPSNSEIEATLGVVGYPNVEVDSIGMRARFGIAGVSVDLGGIAKGYALDQAARAAKRAGATSGMVDLGGNLLVFGNDAAGNIGVQDPKNAERIVGKLRLADQSVATSGGYERFVMIEGTRYSHILNPRTGFPVDELASVTVVADDATRADALSTACAVLGKDACLHLVERLAGVDALVVWYEDDRVRIETSSGLSVLDP